MIVCVCVCLCVSDVESSTQVSAIRSMLENLPEENYESLKFLVQFLALV